MPLAINGRINTIGKGGECNRGPFPKTLVSKPGLQTILKRFNISDKTLTKQKRAKIAEDYESHADSFSDHNYVRNARNAYAPLFESARWNITAGEFTRAEQVIKRLIDVIKTTAHCPPADYTEGRISMLYTALATAKDNTRLKNGQSIQSEHITLNLLTEETVH